MARRLEQLGLDSIRNQVLAFAILAALIPAVSIAALAYEQSRRSLVEQTAEELTATSSQASRELGLWIKERLYDLRVYTGSYEVTENLERVARTGDRTARQRLTGYLDAVRGRTGDYELLVVTDPRGVVAAVSASQAGGPDAALSALPVEWLTVIRQDGTVVGETFWDSAAGKPVVTLAVPVTTGNGRVLGALAAKFSLASAVELLQGFALNRGREVLVVGPGGRVVISSVGVSAQTMRESLSPETLNRLTERAGERLEYRGLDGRTAVGILRQVPRSSWAVVAQVPVAEAFAEVARLRNTAIAIVLALVLGVGWLAFRLGLVIVRPLDRLTAGAAAVAGGDLAVEVPVGSGGEIGYLTRVFNDMVKRLREGREELERLSITDGLTGLYNRRHLMERLHDEGRRSRRSDRPFVLLIMDVDHFKRFNDTYGHQAGDEVLVTVANVLRECVREVDCAARYGGEEFVVLLPDSSAEAGMDVAQRIRKRLNDETFPSGKVTLSIGVAEFPADGETPEFALRAGDAALYRAKHDGRDRIMRARRGRFSQDVVDPKSLRGAKGGRISKPTAAPSDTAGAA